MKEHGEIPAEYKVVETPAIYFIRQYSLSNFGQFTDGLYRCNHKYVTDPSTTTIYSSADITDSIDRGN